MKALLYLTRVRLKNMLVGMIKKPAQLILIIFVVGMIVFTIFSARFDGVDVPVGTPEQFAALIFVFFTMMFVIGLMSGLKRGAGFFSMSDVNFVFHAPISNKKVLMYGLIRQVGVLALGGFFILYQYSWLNNLFGIRVSMLFLLLLGYVVVILSSQVLALLLYSATSSNERMQKLVSRVIFVVFVAAAAVLLLPAVQAALSGPLAFDKILPTLVGSLTRPGVYYIPVLGWMTAFVRDCFHAEGLRLLIPLAATLVLDGALIVIFTLMNVDYYEDVLQSAETSYAALTAQRQGKVKEVLPSKIKVGKVGLGKGYGASAIYYKMAVENRRAQVLFLNLQSMIAIVVTVFLCLLIKEVGTIVPIATNIYIMIFTTLFARWQRDLERHYVYLIPDDPFKKLLYLLGDNILKRLIDAVIIGTIIGVLCSAGILETLGSIAVLFAASMIFIAAVILSERLFGAMHIKWLQVVFLFLTIFIALAPGVAAGIILGITTGSGALGYLVASGISLVISVLILFLCRGMLDRVDING